MKYLARYKATTLASILPRDRQQEHGYGWIKLDDSRVLYDRVTSQNGQYFHQGLGIDVIVEADSFEEAKTTGLAIVTPIFDLISFCTNTELSHIEEEMIIERETTGEETGFRQVLDIEAQSPIVGEVRVIPEEFFVELYNRIHSDRYSEKDRRKLNRGLHRYSSALRQDTKTDQFTWFYIALDAIEYLLRSKHDLEAIREYECDDCGSITEAEDSTAGIRHFVQNCDSVDVEYTDLRDTRGNLFHGGSVGEAPELVEEVMQLFRFAILDVLEISPDKFSKNLLQNINGHLKGEKVVVTGNMIGYKPNSIEQIMDQPIAEIQSKNVSFEIVGDKLRRMPERNVSINLPEGAQISNYAIGERYRGNAGIPDVNNVEFDEETSE